MKIPLTTLFIFFLSFSLPVYSQNTFEEALAVYETGDFDKALGLFTNLIDNKKEEARSLMYRGDCFINLGKAPEAKKDLDRALTLDPSASRIHYFFGRYYFFIGEPQKASVSFTNAIKQDPNDNQSYDGRAIAKVQLKDFKGAIADEDYAISLYATDRTFFNNRGFAKLQLDLLDEAIEDFKASLTLSPNAKAYGNLGLVYIKKEFYSIAVNKFSQALEIIPNDPEILFYRGQCYETVGMLNKACNDYTQIKIIYDQMNMKNPDIEAAIKRINCI